MSGSEKADGHEWYIRMPVEVAGDRELSDRAARAYACLLEGEALDATTVRMTVEQLAASLQCGRTAAYAVVEELKVRGHVLHERDRATPGSPYVFTLLRQRDGKAVADG